MTAGLEMFKAGVPLYVKRLEESMSSYDQCLEKARHSMELDVVQGKLGPVDKEINRLKRGNNEFQSWKAGTDKEHVGIRARETVCGGNGSNMEKEKTISRVKTVIALDLDVNPIATGLADWVIPIYVHTA